MVKIALATIPSDAASSIATKKAVAKKAPAADPYGILGSTDPYTSVLKMLGAVPSLASLPATARKNALASLAPSLAGLDLTSQVEQRQLSNQETRASEFAKALAAMNAQAGNQVYGDYADAAKTFGALGQGLTGAVAGDWNAQTQKVNDAIQQMTGGQGGSIQGTYDPNAMANTQGVANVALPATSLEEQALRAGALTRASVAAGVGSLADVANQYASKLSDARATEAASRTSLYAQEPSLIQKALESLTGDRTTQIGNITKIVQQAQASKTAAAQTGFNNTLALKGLAIKQHTADVYNAYLSGKGVLSTQEANWKHQYDQAQTKLKAQTLSNARLSTALKAAGITGVDTQGNTLPGFYPNPKTGRIEKQPAGTYIGKDGMPHKLASSTANKPQRPTGTNLADLHTNMLAGLTSQYNIFSTSLTATPTWRTQPQLEQWLMNNFGSTFIAQYPDQAAAVRQQVTTVAKAAIGWLQLQQRNKKQAAARAAKNAASSGIGVGPNG